MPRIDKILQNQPREIARQVARALDRRDSLTKINRPVYDGDLSWKSITSIHARDTIAQYQPNESGLNDIAGLNKKLNII